MSFCPKLIGHTLFLFKLKMMQCSVKVYAKLRLFSSSHIIAGSLT